MTQIQGVHPYADKFPMLPDGELEELAESIKQNGQRQPIVLTTDGLILDGRNRAKACKLINVEPEVTTYNGDDLAEYVIDSNTSRRHMSTGARAMSTALVLVDDGQRKNGRWKRGSSDIYKSVNTSGTWSQLIHRAGLILDHSPNLADQVVSGDLALDAAFRQAEESRDAERKKLEQQQRLEAEESDAKAFIEENDPELAKQVGDVFQSYVEAHDVWKRRNREEAERIKREQVAKERAERERRASLTDMYSNGIGRSLMTLGSYGQRNNPAEVMAEFSDDLLDPPQLKREYSHDNIKSARRFLDTLLEWSST